MLRKYHFRIGNEKYAHENKSYGITTLQPRHIKFHSPSKFTIEFIGKKGVVNKYSDDNEHIAQILKTLIKHTRDNNTSINNIKFTPSTPSTPSTTFIFAYRTPSGESSLITPDHIQTFFQDKYDSYITPKMFRTWYGNFHMLEHLRNLFKNDQLAHRMNTTDTKNIITKCSEYVSSKLNNTPSISKKSYIDNKLLDLVMKNPYRIAANIPDNKEEQHRFLNKMIMKLRN
jgi:DNA topoisomerase-1